MRAAQPHSYAPAKTFRFGNCSEAIAAAAYVEQILAAEYQWITNRLSWLFVSQSFCITAYTIMVTTSTARDGSNRLIDTLRVGLPLLGIVCCFAVGIAVIAAAYVARKLANERARLAKHINQEYGTMIPLVGTDGDLRDQDLKWTQWCGSLPHLLPWVLLMLWVFLLIRV